MECPQCGYKYNYDETKNPFYTVSNEITMRSFGTIKDVMNKSKKGTLPEKYKYIYGCPECNTLFMW